MAKNKTLETELNEFLELWNGNQICDFLRDIIPLFELYDVEDEEDWVEKEVGGDEDHVRAVRLARTVYLLSRISEFHTNTMSMTRCKFRDLYKRMEKAAVKQ